MTTRDEIIAEARSWLGVKWRHQGRTRHGLDCAGIVVVVGRALGLHDYDQLDYGRVPDGESFERHLRVALQKIAVADAGPGDVLTFRERVYQCHCGIVAADRFGPTVIHAYVLRRAVVEEPLAHFTSGADGDLRVSGFRFRGVEA